MESSEPHSPIFSLSRSTVLHYLIHCNITWLGAALLVVPGPSAVPSVLQTLQPVHLEDTGQARYMYTPKLRPAQSTAHHSTPRHSHASNTRPLDPRAPTGWHLNNKAMYVPYRLILSTHLPSTPQLYRRQNFRTRLIRN